MRIANKPKRETGWLRNGIIEKCPKMHVQEKRAQKHSKRETEYTLYIIKVEIR
jgi:hypothetical protein